MQEDAFEARIQSALKSAVSVWENMINFLLLTGGGHARGISRDIG